jgi:hypothetical protein
MKLISRIELLNELQKFNLVESYFLNNKKISLKKLKNVLHNNLTHKNVFNFSLVRKNRPFYKGDFKYFMSAYSKKCRQKKLKMYINALE